MSGEIVLDILLIKHRETGLNLIEYRQDEMSLTEPHSNIFSGFLSALQSIMSHELDIGEVSFISTSGEKGHNCIVVSNPPIDIVILVDQDDPIDLWKELGEDVANKFIHMYGIDLNPSLTNIYEEFIDILKEMCSGQGYCT